MAHRVDGRKLGRKMGPRLALFRNLTVSVLRYERVKTTEAKAKEVRGRVERMITLAKRGDLTARRAVLQAFPNEPLVEARCERIVALGGDPFREYMLPEAVLQLRQGFGRLVRSHSDTGVIAILDPRLRSSPYGRAFLESLPSCPVTTDRAAVAAFFGAGALTAA